VVIIVILLRWILIGRYRILSVRRVPTILQQLHKIEDSLKGCTVQESQH